jgi:hypothetical protein
MKRGLHMLREKPVLLNGTASQAAEKLPLLLSEGAGGFSPLKNANGFKGL